MVTADLLRRAATVLREHASAAGVDYLRCDPDSEVHWADGLDSMLGGPIGKYCGLLTPAVATHVADWLEAAAAGVEANDACDGFDLDAVDDTHRAAVAVARAILREPA